VGAGRQKKLTNRSTTDCTRHLRLCAVTVSYFEEEPRIPGEYVAIDAGGFGRRQRGQA
jgi:hypothetical protein